MAFYEGRHLFSLDGVRANHFLQRVRLDFLAADARSAGIGVTGEFFDRRTYYQDAESHAQELPLSADEHLSRLEAVMIRLLSPLVFGLALAVVLRRDDRVGAIGALVVTDEDLKGAGSDFWFVGGGSFSTIRGDCQTCEEDYPYRHSGSVLANARRSCHPEDGRRP